MNETTCKFLKKGKGDLPCAYYIRAIDPNEPGFCSRETVFRCIEAMKRKLPRISYSRLTDFISCRRKYEYGVVDGLRLKTHCLPEAMKAGRTWDISMRSRYEDGFDGQNEIQALQLSPEQIAKQNALNRAFTDLEVSLNRGDLLGCQRKIFYPVGRHAVTGYVDRAYDDHIVESKLSSRPDFYQQKENILYQIGTYLLSNEQWEFAIMEIVRYPQTRMGQETPEAYESRVHSDIISRPSHYLPGWDRKSKTFGIKFWRSEFDLDEVFRTYTLVCDELKRAVIHNAWWPNKLSCHVPGPCVYLPICRTGVVSQEIYEQGVKPVFMWKGGDPE